VCSLEWAVSLLVNVGGVVRQIPYTAGSQALQGTSPWFEIPSSGSQLWTVGKIGEVENYACIVGREWHP
jgi:hypothetical protein